MAAEVSFVELRKQAQALGINVTGKRPADLQKEIDKLATKKTAPATATKAKAGPVTTKVTPAAAAVAAPAADVRVLALEEEVEGLKASIRSVMKALTAVGAEIGFDVNLDMPALTMPAEEAAAPAAKKTRGRPKKEEPAPAPEPEEEEAEEGDDEEAVDFTSEEIEGADMARLKEIAELLNDNNDAEIEIGKNEKKLRAAIMKWMNDNAEKVADDEPEATEKEEAEDDEDEDEDDEAEAEATPCPDYCKKGAKVQVMFEAENGEEEWVDGVVAVVESTSADVKLATGQVAEVPFDSMRLPVVKKVKAAVKRK